MKLLSERWQSLYRSRPGEWDEALLAAATGDELEALCRLMGIAHSGTRTQRVARLLAMAALRRELATWGEYQGSEGAHKLAYAIAQRYTKAALLRLSRQAGLFIGTNKCGLATGLLSWRARCRARGQAFDDELRRAAVVQRRLI